MSAQKPVVVRRRHDKPDFLRLLPAAIASLLFHGLLILFLMFLMAPNHAATAERFAEATIESSPAEKERHDPLLVTAIDPAGRNPEQEPSFKAEVIADYSVPGTVNPHGPMGIIDGKDVPPFSMPAPEGFGPGGQGGLPATIFGSELAIRPGEQGGYLSQAALAGTFHGRGGAAKQQALIEGGGTTETEACVSRGLKWLVRTQQPNGSWKLDDPRFKDRGRANDTAATAFGLLPLLGSGYTHKKSAPGAPFNPYDKPIDKALIWLISHQNKRDGFLGDDMYGHCLAAIALCEAYGLSQDRLLRNPAQMAVNYLIRTQHEAGGWRYGPRQAGDLSVSGWAIMGLKSAQMAGLDVPETTMRKAVNFVNSVCNESNEGYGYVAPGSSETMSAVGLLCRQYMQAWGSGNIRMIKGISNHLKTRPPAAVYKNIYYYYYATQVMHHFGGNAWKDWNAKMRELLVKSQQGDAETGSWAADGDRHAAAGGRLMMTSLTLMTLEVYYRHLPLYYRESGERQLAAKAP